MLNVGAHMEVAITYAEYSASDFPDSDARGYRH
jgi:hypothetical protein